jgi:hypothetical protein
MEGFDPTSLAQPFSLPPDLVSTVEQVAYQQHELVDKVTPEDDTGDAGVAADEDDDAGDGTPRRAISGRYRSQGELVLELRVDVDGVRPTGRVSGDFFHRSGATTKYTGSFMVTAPSIEVKNGEVVIEGEGVYSFTSGSPLLRVTIDRLPDSPGRPKATAQFLTTGGVPGREYVCRFESRFFRTVEFEQDFVEEIRPFTDYDTATLPSGGSARVLDMRRSYFEAGIELVRSGGENAVAISLAGSDGTWSDAELHAAMTEQFTRWSPDPAWRVWILAATRHEDPKYRGLMFDRGEGARHQGCAIFHEIIEGGAGTEEEIRRGMLRTYVHEVGHCFNLYHWHQKSLTKPPGTDRLDALSWMHYPRYYVGPAGTGEPAFWAAFPFQFEDEEIVHLRHGFRNFVIPGGGTLGIGAADVDSEQFADLVADESGLKLEISAPARVLLGAPVVVEIRLGLADRQEREVNANIHPNSGFVQIGIARVGGVTMVYRPLITHCAEPEMVTLTREDPAVYDSAYIGFGKDGFYFGTPGDYELRARYNGPDGSVIVSNVWRLRVKSPATADDEHVADLFLGSDQGTLLYLLGSDSPELRSGREAMETVIEDFDEHPISAYANMVQGINSSRDFKAVDDRKITCRKRDAEESEPRLEKMLQRTIAREPAPPLYDRAPGSGVPRLDNVSLGMVARRLAGLKQATGNARGAEETALSAIDYFLKQQLKAHVCRKILAQMSPYLTEEKLREKEYAISAREAAGQQTQQR